MTKWFLFDCFDTILIKRKSHLFDWNKQISDELHMDERIVGEIRKKAISTVASRSSICEYSFRDAMINFYERYLSINDYQVSISLENFYEEALQIEVECITKSVLCNCSLIKKINRIKSEGNKVIVLSDFYLGKEFFSNLFENKGITIVFDDILVSCDINANKSSGTAYQYFLDKYEISSKDCTMLGDNFYSDYYRAKQNGLCAKWYRTPSEKNCLKH